MNVSFSLQCFEPLDTPETTILGDGGNKMEKKLGHSEAFLKSAGGTIAYCASAKLLRCVVLYLAILSRNGSDCIRDWSVRYKQVLKSSPQYCGL